MAYGLQSLTGFEAAVPSRLRLFTQDFDENLMPYVSVIGEKIALLNDRRIDMLNLRYLGPSGRTPSVFPRFLIVAMSLSLRTRRCCHEHSWSGVTGSRW
jgi:hypothetical protein